MSVTVTWWGHATVLIEDRARFLTDPLLTHAVVHLRRRRGPRPSTDAHWVDAVLISHLHSDHMHLSSLALLPKGTTIVVPKGARRLLRKLSLDVIEVVPGDSIEFADALLLVVPAMHDGSRWPWPSARAPAVGYVMEGSSATYFAGDTTEFPEMADLHADLDVALLPVGGWGPWLRGHHLNADDAAHCLAALRPRTAVPIHYGTFWPRGLSWLRSHVFHDPGHDFASAARESGVDIRVLAPGESTTVAARRTP
jgi:L-ascorbate metabolism protein UlaG (beta-lactamase superfamily)